MASNVERFPIGVLCRILRHMPVADLARMMATSKRLRRLAASEITNQVYALLEEYVGDSKGFLRLLQEYDATVSGSFVLFLLHKPTNWRPGDIDIFVSSSRCCSFVQRLCEFLDVLPEACTDSRSYYEGHLENIDHVLTVTAKGYNFQVVATSTDAATGCIPFFDTTLVMNVLHHDHIAVAYPRLTLEESGIIHPTGCTMWRSYSPTVVKYAARGYTIQHARQGVLPSIPESDPNMMLGVPGEGCGGSYTCPTEYRWFYDEKSLLIPIGGNMVTKPRCSVAWSLGGHGCGDKCVQYSEFWMENVYVTQDSRCDTLLSVM